jgi:D-amino-acid oxidase
MSNSSVSEPSRRGFLRGALAGSALLMTTRWPAAAAALATERRFAPVKVARERIIREVVGLRPYRPEGFKVEAERLGNKLLIHNYGHGGAGVTLSWGTASLAVDLARDSPPTSSRPHSTRPRHFAVLGCGVNGLSTARLLQRRFQNGPGTVTIYAKDLPPETTSNIAGGFWSPTSLFDPEVVTTRFTEQFRLACRISNRAFQSLVGPEYGVRWMETFELYRHEASLTRELPGGDELYPAREVHRDPEHYFGFPFVRQYQTMLIEPPVYLHRTRRAGTLRRQVTRAGARPTGGAAAATGN